MCLYFVSWLKCEALLKHQIKKCDIITITSWSSKIASSWWSSIITAGSLPSSPPPSSSPPLFVPHRWNSSLLKKLKVRQNFEKKENKRQNCEKRNGDKRGLRWRGKKWSKCIFLSSGINVYIFLAGLQRWGNSQKPRWTIVEYCWQSSRKGKCCSRCLDIWTIVSNHDDKTAQGVWTDWPHPPFTRAGLFEPGDELWYRFTVSRFWCLISRSSTEMLSEQCWPHTCWWYSGGWPGKSCTEAKQASIPVDSSWPTHWQTCWVGYHDHNGDD